MLRGTLITREATCRSPLAAAAYARGGGRHIIYAIFDEADGPVES